MASVTDRSAHLSVSVAPLNINKSGSRTPHEEAVQHLENPASSMYMQMTPPATPNSSQEAFDEHLEAAPAVFHAFLRAFYPFHPTSTISDSTVTLPLNEGDVVLVHSIHTNGWADGTLLPSGARGWLPTNYCEAYEPDSMQSLLKGLLNFWDLLKSGTVPDHELFGNQEFMRGIIAGVRYLLEKSNCLTRESPLVKLNDLLRRHRKALLSDLSSLVKSAKSLHELTRRHPTPEIEDVNEYLDGMILKAFRIVTRAVNFLDVLDDFLRSYHLANIGMSTLAEEVCVPPTPPADSTLFEHRMPASDAGSRRTSQYSSTTDLSSPHTLPDEQTVRHMYKRTSTNLPSQPHSFQSRPRSFQDNRLSLSHRVSTTSPFPAEYRSDLVSERLSSSHDTFLSYLGSFIGRLHLQSQTSTDLVLAIRQSISAGRSLITIVEAVCSHDVQSHQSLQSSKDTMYECINQLLISARECVRPSGSEEEDVMSPQENARLKDAATDCVVAAGECVAKTKFIIERIGDFELEPRNQGLGFDVNIFGAFPSIQVTSTEDGIHSLSERRDQLDAATSKSDTLQSSPSDITLKSHTSLSSEQFVGAAAEISPTTAMTLLPPLSNHTGPMIAQYEYNRSENPSGIDTEFNHSIRSASTEISTSGSSSTYLSGMRDSEVSMASSMSTRATTPDHSPSSSSYKSPRSSLGMTDSQSTLADDIDEAESRMLEKTFAHELLLNKEGQITGGTLPALVERLTTHDSTPDAMFVSTFYLTFRLFVTPLKLAEALVDRFDYVSESPHIAGPVRLRVYNVFKGWLESHWRESTDHEAIVSIELFAEGKLASVLPAAGRRLLELISRVSSNDGTLVPRLLSSMGKTSTSIAQYIPPDTPLPTPVLSKSQTSTLRNWKMGGSTPSILDFDPLELARQLTIKEMNIFCSIMPEELLASEWMKKSGSNAINVRAMSTLSTDLSNLVADTILQHEDAKKRAQFIKQWIKIAQKCLELNNYDSVMAIICSLNSSTIMRLKKTWDIVSQKRKDVLKTFQEIIEPTKNHAILRQRLQNHVPPCLPFVGTYLTDLTFVDIGNPATKQLPGVGGQGGISVINFDKHARTAKIIGELQRFQIPYRLTEVPDLQEWLEAQIIRVRCSNDQNNIQRYYRKSLLLEPRTTFLKSSPVDSNVAVSHPNGAKEKFDLFSWTHPKEKSGSVQALAVPV